MSMIEMVVEGIGMDPHNNPLVLLRDEERKTFVPIWIGPAEAMSIQMELDNKQPPRPMTHDLISNILRELGVRLIKVSVNDFDGSVHYATLHLQVGRAEEDLQEVDARPSDAIALALRAQCRILVSSSVADKVGIQVEEADAQDMAIAEAENGDGESPDEIEKFSRLLEGVDLGESEKN